MSPQANVPGFDYPGRCPGSLVTGALQAGVARVVGSLPLWVPTRATTNRLHLSQKSGCSVWWAAAAHGLSGGWTLRMGRQPPTPYAVGDDADGES